MLRQSRQLSGLIGRPFVSADKAEYPASSTNLTQVVGREIEVYASERGRNEELSNQRERVVSSTLTRLSIFTYEYGVPKRIFSK